MSDDYHMLGAHCNRVQALYEVPYEKLLISSLTSSMVAAIFNPHFHLDKLIPFVFI